MKPVFHRMCNFEKVNKKYVVIKDGDEYCYWQDI